MASEEERGMKQTWCGNDVTVLRCGNDVTVLRCGNDVTVLSVVMMLQC